MNVVRQHATEIAGSPDRPADPPPHQHASEIRALIGPHPMRARSESASKCLCIEPSSYATAVPASGGAQRRDRALHRRRRGGRCLSWAGRPICSAHVQRSEPGQAHHINPEANVWGQEARGWRGACDSTPARCLSLILGVGVGWRVEGLVQGEERTNTHDGGCVIAQRTASDAQQLAALHGTYMMGLACVRCC